VRWEVDQETQRVRLFADPHGNAGLGVDISRERTGVLLGTSGSASRLVLQDEAGAMLFKAPPDRRE
jgi:hypothetical protein